MSSNTVKLEDSVISVKEIIELRQFGNRLLNCETLDEVIEALFEKVHLQIHPQICSVFLYKKDSYIERVGLRGTDRYGNSIEDNWLPNEHYAPGESFSGKAAKPLNPSTQIYGTSVFCKNIKEEYAPLKYQKEYEDKLGNLKEGISVPLNGGHRTFGTIEIINKLNSEGTLDPETSLNERDFSWLTVVGSHVSAAISRLRKSEEDKIVALITKELVKRNSSEDKVDDSLGTKVAESLVNNVLMPYKACVIRKLSKDKKILQLDANVCSPDITQKPNYQRRIEDKGVIRDIFVSQTNIKIKKIEDNLNRFQSRDWVEKNSLKSFFGFPCLIQGEVVGTIALFTGYEYNLDENEEDFINNIACLLATYRVGVRKIAENKKNSFLLTDTNLYSDKFNRSKQTELKEGIEKLVLKQNKISKYLLLFVILTIVCVVLLGLAVYTLIYFSLSASYTKLLLMAILLVIFFVFKLILQIRTTSFNFSLIKRLIDEGRLLERKAKSPQHE